MDVAQNNRKYLLQSLINKATDDVLNLYSRLLSTVKDAYFLKPVGNKATLEDHSSQAEQQLPTAAA